MTVAIEYFLLIHNAITHFISASCSDSYILSSLVEECNMTPNSETNNSEIAMSIMMDLMGGDDALGGPMDLNDLTWPL